MKNYIQKALALFFISLFSNRCFAEGQSEISELFGYFNSFMVITNILVYTILLGFLLRFGFQKFNSKIQNRNSKAFLASLLVSVLLNIIFKDKFTYLIFDLLRDLM